jgi:hypothetical protein
MPIGQAAKTQAQAAKPAATAPAGAKRPAATKAPPKRASRYAGISAAVPRDPMPTVGVYRFRFLGLTEGVNPGTGTESSKATFEVVGADGDGASEVGSTVVAINLLTGKGGPSGLARVKAMVMAIAGYDDEDAYNEMDPDGSFIDACHGYENARAEDAAAMIGRLVDCEVTRGNPTPDGNDYYRQFAWGAVADEEQDAAE